ncbi:MAG: leucine-rich repeat protein [Butyrivibrio sp.]|nr:leucine-rich repeat protein [Muribaculum sp.]MCM1552174.1 leucine-rich repeat protein [Butyrivibrio sp.]
MRQRRLIALLLTLVLTVTALPMDVLAAGAVVTTHDGSESMLGEESVENVDIESEEQIETEEMVDDEEGVASEGEASDEIVTDDLVDEQAEDENMEDEGIEEYAEFEDEIVATADTVMSGKCGDNLTWEIKDGVMTISGTGEMWDDELYSRRWMGIYIKSLIFEEGITYIGRRAFEGCSGLTGSLTIPDSVTSIGYGAFEDCGFTGNLTIGNRVTSIGAGAFYNCDGFTGDLLIPDSVIEIKGGDDYDSLYGAFENCSGFTGKLALGSSLTSIEYGTFSGCNGFTGDLLIPDSVTEIGEYAFFGCSGFTGDLTIPDGVTSIGGYAFDNCSGFTGGLTISDDVTSIGRYAFYGCSGFTGNLIIPDGVTSIEQGVFSGCSGFTGSLTIPDGVTSIGYGAFYYCRGFTGDLVIPDSVIIIGSDSSDYYRVGAFEGCSGFTGTLTIGKSVMKIGQCTFKNCSSFTGDLMIPDSVTNIGRMAFIGCSGFTSSLMIPDSVTEIGSNAFAGCSGFTGNLTIGNSVTEIGGRAFADCNGFTGNLTIGNSVTEIWSGAFEGCSGFTGNLTIPNSVAGIGSCAFEGCSGFTGDLLIGNSVIDIDVGAFYACDGFKGNLVIGHSVTSIGSGAFAGCSGFIGDLIIPDSVTDMAGSGYLGGAFENCKGFSGDLVIGNGIKSIERGMFRGCSGFTGDLIIGNSVTSIGSRAFSDCGNFTGDLVIGNSVTSIGDHAFYKCSGFTGSLIIPDSVTEIGENAFYGCSSFTGSLMLPSSVISLGSYAFCGCRGFTGSLMLPDSVMSIGNYTFYRCGFTGSLTIPDSVTRIGSEVFAYCSGFTGSLTIPDSVMEIGESAFRDCSSLSGKIYIPSSVTSIGYNAFSEISSKNICGIPDSYAETYALENNIPFTDVGALGTTTDSFTVGEEQAAICVVDKATKKTIPFAKVYIDGKLYSTGVEGVLYIEDGLGKTQYISAIAEQYKTVIGQIVELSKGQQFVLYLDKIDADEWFYGNLNYANGVLTSVDAVTTSLVIDEKTYHTTEDFNFTNANTFLNNAVLVKLNNKGIVTDIDLLENKIVPTIILSSDCASVTYENKEYSDDEFTIYADISWKLPQNIALSDSVKDIEISFDKFIFSIEGNGLGFNKSGILWGTPENEQEANISCTLKYGEHKEIETKVYLWKNNIAIEDSIKAEYNIQGKISYKNAEYYGTRTMSVVNIVKQETAVAAKKSVKKSNTQAKTVAANIQKFENTCVTLPNEIHELVGDTATENNIREILTISIGQAMSTYQLSKEKDVSDKLFSAVMKKFGLDMGTLQDSATLFGNIYKRAYFTTKINVETQKYGNQTIEFELECGVGGFDTNSVQYGYGTIKYTLTGSNKNLVPKSCATGEMGGQVTYTNCEAFINSMKDYELSAIEGAFDSSLKGVDQIAEMSIDSSTRDILTALNWVWGTGENLANGDMKKAKKFASFKDGIWYILTQPAKRTAKKISVHCPVDVYIYDSDNVLCGVIADNSVLMETDEILLWVEGEEKYIQLYGDDYEIKFVGTDLGTMTYKIAEYEDDLDTAVREVEFQDVPLSKKQTYFGYMPEQLYVNSVIYGLTTSKKDVIYSNSDTLRSEKEENIDVTNLFLDNSGATLKINETLQLSYEIEPNNATHQDVFYQSMDETIATVDKDGKVTAVGEGTTDIIATVFAEKAAAKCTIIVMGKQAGDEEFVLHYELNGGTNHKDNPAKYNGMEDIILHDPIRTGYTFGGWYADTEWEQKVTDIPVGSFGDKTFYAKWTPNSYNIMFDANGGIVSGAELNVTYDDIYGELPVPVKDGYDFEGWFTERSAGTRIMADMLVKITQDSVLYAHWKQTGDESGSESGSGSGGESGDEKGFKIKLANPNEEYCYTGGAIKPEVLVTNNGNKLIEGIDYTVKYSNNTKASTDAAQNKKPKITVTGKGNLKGSTSAYFEIQKRDLKDVTVGNTIVTSGSKAAPILIYENYKLTSRDFTCGNLGKKYTESGVMSLSGKGNFTGQIEIPITVVSKESLKKFTVTLGRESLYYDGKAKKISFEVKDSKTKEKLISGTHYIVVWSDDMTNAGKKKFTVMGIGEYTGSVTKSYTIKPMKATQESIEVSGIKNTGYPYQSTGVTVNEDIVVTCRVNGVKVPLYEGKDYKITYSNNKKVGSAAKYTVSFLGNYKGTKAKSGYFTIKAARLSNSTEGIKIVTEDKVYTGKAGAYVSKPYVAIGGVALTAKDYAVKYYKDAGMTQEIKGKKNNISLASGEMTATVWIKITGRGNYAAENESIYATAQYRVCRKENLTDLSKARVMFVDENGRKLTKLEYTGKEIEPTIKVQVKVGKTYETIDASNYQVSYVNNVGKGRATAVITATGKGYTGSKSATFQIVPRNLQTLSDLWKNLAKESSRIFNQQ